MKCLPASASFERLLQRLWRVKQLQLVKRTVLAAMVLALAGCAQLPHDSVVGDVPPVQVPPPPPVKPDGSIFQNSHQASYGTRPLFEDSRPRLAGDLLTVVFNEQVSASKSSQSNANRDSESSFSPDVVPDGLDKLSDYALDLKGKHDFTSGGGSRANNTFTGTITVTVTQVLGNGNLRVRGEKQIAINQGTEYIRFAGTVDPRTIGADNSVLSTRVADARIEYVGEGYISEAQHMGWLQRLLINISPF